MPVVFPASYAIDPKNFVQGPARLWYAPYVTAGGDAPQGTIVSIGAIDKGGIEFDHKLGFSATEIDQSTTEPDGFLTKQDFDVKATLTELSPVNLTLAMGAQPGALVVGGGVNTQSLGEYFDVQAGANPSMRPPYRQWIFQFPSPTHDNTTSPIGAWGYLQLYKAFVSAHGPVRFSKDNLATIQITLHAVADFTVAGAFKIGKLITQ